MWGDRRHTAPCPHTPVAGGAVWSPQLSAFSRHPPEARESQECQSRPLWHHKLIFQNWRQKKVAKRISPETLLTCQIPVVSGKVTHLLLVHLQLGPAVGEDVGQVGRRDQGGGQVCGGRAQAVTGEAGPADPTHRAPAGATRAGGIA